MKTAIEARTVAAQAPALRPRLSLFDATMLVVGAMIGSGIFIVSADMARTMNSAGWLLLVWLATGVITLLGALSYGELAAAMPKAGGQYVFLREGLGPMWGFLYGWTLFVVIQTGTIAAVAVAFARFLSVFVPSLSPDVFLPLGKVPMPGGVVELGLSAQRIVALLVVALLTAVNIRGVREAKWVQNIFTVAKTAALLGLILVGLTYGRDPAAWRLNFAHPFAGAPVGWALVMAFGAAAVGSLFSSDAWNNVTFAAAEVHRPSRNLPLAMALGTGTVTLLYVLANVAYLSALTLPEIQHAPQDRVGTALAQHVHGGLGLYLMAGAILVSTFGCINGLILAGARVLYSMARDGLFFRPAAEISVRGEVPAKALLMQGAWTCLLTLSGTYGQLLDYVIFAALVFYALTTLSLFRLRFTRPDLPRPYRAIGYPVLPALYLLATTAIAVILLIAKPLYSTTGLVLVVLGVPVYLAWRRGAPRTPA
ncbi:MAG TPA: amino acid permease [Longimicrobiales bacterium]|nr:amino acid permease [Longimicrobiales bacterium]